MDMKRLISSSAISENDLLIAKENNKNKQLKIELSQIQANLMEMRLLNDEKTKLIKQFSKKNDSAKYQNVVQTYKNQALQLLNRYQQHLQNKSKTMTAKLETKQQLQCVKSQDMSAKFKIQSTRSLYYDLSQQIRHYRKQCENVQQKIQTLSQQLHKRQRSPDLTQKLPAFIQEIKTKFLNSVSPQQLTYLQNLNFNQFSYFSNQQIIKIKQQISSLRYSIIQSKQTYFAIDIQLRNLGNTQEQLQKLENQNRQMEEQMHQIMRHNDDLQLNMEQQVDRIVDEKMIEINMESGNHASKYILSAEYLIKKLKDVLSQQDRDQFYSQINTRRQSIRQKLNQMN